MSPDTDRSPLSRATPPPWRAVVLLATVSVIFVCGLAFREQLHPAVAWLQEKIESLGPWAPVAYVALFLVWTIVGLPASIIVVIGGTALAEQKLVAVASVLAGGMGSAAVNFLISRHFGRRSVVRWVGRTRGLAALDRATEAQGVWIVAMTRLVPMFPFALLNYGFGLTRIGFAKYMITSSICMVPGLVVLVLGSAAIVDAITEGTIPWAMLAALAVVALVGASAGFLAQRRWRRADCD